MGGGWWGRSDREEWWRVWRRRDLRGVEEGYDGQKHIRRIGERGGGKVEKELVYVDGVGPRG